MLYDADGTRTTSFAEARRQLRCAASATSAAHFVDCARRRHASPRWSGETAIKVLQLCFAVYQASIERGPVDPATIDGSVSPPWWPPFKLG